MKRWTKQELELLKAHYGKLPVEELSEMLGRNARSIYSKAHYMSLCAGEVWNKTQWTPAQDEFLKKNFRFMTNARMAKILGMKRTVVRMRAYYLGLQRMQLQSWTEEQVQFLRDNYTRYGDTELAEMFTRRWEKDKGWTKKHIEKKRRYLNLKRTDAQRKAVFNRNKKNGAWAMCPVNAWKKRGVNPVGKVILWDNPTPTPYIRTATGYERLSRFMWEYHNGPIPKGNNIFHLDGNAMNCRRGNLIMVSNADLVHYTSAPQRLTDNYIAGMLTHGRKDLREEIKKHPEIIETKRLQLKLQREINKQQ